MNEKDTYKSGYLENKNARKAELPFDDYIQIRLPKSQKENWRRQASKEGLSLTDWIKKKLNSS